MPLELAGALVADEDERLLQAEATVRSYCGWHIAPARAETATFPATDSHVLMLDSLNVTDVVSVTENGTTVDVADYEWDRRGWLTRISCRWSTGPVVVEFTHGFNTVPADVTAAVQALAQQAISTNGVLTRKTVGPFTDAYGLPGDTLAALGAYRLPPRP